VHRTHSATQNTVQVFHPGKFSLTRLNDIVHMAPSVP